MNNSQENPEKNLKRHGGCYDRGAADSYYGRQPTPHYFTADTYASELVEEHDMTPEENSQYSKGFADNEREGNFKEW